MNEFLFSMNASYETTFDGNRFCQWLITNNHVENQFIAQNYLQKLIDQKQIICINQKTLDSENDILSNWYAFAK